MHIDRFTCLLHPGNRFSSSQDFSLEVVVFRHNFILSLSPNAVRLLLGLTALLVACSVSRYDRLLLADEKPLAKTKSPTLKTDQGEVEIFPADNPWNQDVSMLPIHPLSAKYLESVGTNKPLHPDFGTVWNGVPIGIPYVVVSAEQSKTQVEFQYAGESDPGPYPIPANPPIEGGPNAPQDNDRHILMIDPKQKKLYELYQAIPLGNGKWKAGSGAVFDLSSNTLRPKGWTSADAAGLPIFPGLARYDEIVERRELRHALRFTVKKTQRAYIAPARHFASSLKDPNRPPMGLRLRLKADYDISGFPPPVQVVLTGMKRYGLILADNGGDGFISGVPDPRWDDDALSTLKRVKFRDFEAVETGPVEK